MNRGQVLLDFQLVRECFRAQRAGEDLGPQEEVRGQVRGQQLAGGQQMGGSVRQSLEMHLSHVGALATRGLCITWNKEFIYKIIYDIVFQCSQSGFLYVDKAFKGKILP